MVKYSGAVEQRQVAKAAPCPFCGAQTGVDCVPGAVFPQYPHTSRLAAALGLSVDDWLEISEEKAQDLVREALTSSLSTTPDREPPY